MATVNKDFKIKSGLIVEGTTATVNGNQVLTETASDQYIIDLIGGETLVTSVESTQMEVIAGELNIKSGVFDADGAADTAELNAKNYADGLATNYDPAGSATTAENNAKAYADGLASNYDAAGSASSAQTAAQNYADGLASNYDAAGSAAAAQQNAEDYADALINDASNLSTQVWSAYKTNTEIGLAQSAAESYADTAIANLVDSAPATLDTLNELAAALQDNPDIITDLQDIAAGKQDTLTAGSNIDITGATISVTGLDSADISDFNTAALTATASAYDAAGSATTAENNAKAYTDNQLEAYTPSSSLEATIDGYGFAYSSEIPGSTDSLTEGVNNLYYTNYRAKAQAAALLTNATKTNITITADVNDNLTITAENGVEDSTTDDLAEGTGNLYFTNSRAVDAIGGSTIAPFKVEINDYRREEASRISVANASTATVHSFDYPYESAKYVVRIVGSVNGTKHSQITEILLTTDGNNNIAITEYGTTHTSTEPLATFSAAWTGTYDLTVTTLVAGCEVIAAATLLSWAD